MTRAYLLINTDTGMEKGVIDKIVQFLDIVYIFRVYGTYDVIALLEVPDINYLKQIVTDQIRTIKGIRSTSTLIIF